MRANRNGRHGPRGRRGAGGFSLLELIMAMVIGGVILTTVIVYVTETLPQSQQTLDMLNTGYALRKEMDVILYKYRDALEDAEASGTPFRLSSFVPTISTIDAVKHYDASSSRYVTFNQTQKTWNMQASGASNAYLVVLVDGGESLAMLLTDSTATGGGGGGGS